MLLTLVIILILIWSAVVGSLYSNFLVFYQNFTETENYHKARYASIAALERAELVTKQREPWYVWSWWRIMSADQLWSNSDKMPGSNWTGFSYLSKDFQNNSTIFRKVNSKTDRIPSTWNWWNVEKLLSAEDSPNYNMMDYENAEVLLLYYDKGDYEKPYDKKTCPDDCYKTDLNWITVAIRLPPLIRTKFGNLDTDTKLIEDWWYEDDAIVDWQVRWDIYSGDKATSFTIFATQEALWYATGENDSAIRESHLNQLSWLTLNFSNKRNPVTNQLTKKPTIISSQDEAILNRNAFKGIFEQDNTANLQLRLSLLNLVLWWWTIWKRYPFLEYNVEFTPIDSSTPVILSDKYFTIQTEWNFWDYQIDNIVFKPTITESILKSFTTIF